MQVTLIQQDIVWGDVAANHSLLDSALAAAPSSELYVLPEMFSTGFATQREATVEEVADCRSLEWMKCKAAGLGAAICGSVALHLSDGRCVNRLYFVKPDGSVTQYDKRHLFNYGGEGERFSAGDRRVIVEWKGVRFLLCVCYDLRFPVWLRNRGDYDALIAVANWPVPRRFAWDTLTRARAIENQCYVLAVNRTGTDPACEYNGGTALINPFGETVCSVDDCVAGPVCGILDIKNVQTYWKRFPVLEDADSFELRIE